MRPASHSEFETPDLQLLTSDQMCFMRCYDESTFNRIRQSFNVRAITH